MWDVTMSRVRSFLDSRGFVEVRTPLLVDHPGMEPNLDPFAVDVHVLGGGKKRMGLITSPEYSMKKLVGAGIEKVYTMTQTFRNFESGSLNIPEFMMLEWYAPGDYEELMAETEELLQYVLEDKAPWKRIQHQNAKMDAFGDPHVEEEKFFVTQYPTAEASLARHSKNGAYAERFEAFARGMEMCNGFCELTDAVEQRARFKNEQEERRAAGKEVFPIDEELLEAISKIKGPVYGNALGVDRLIMLKYGIHNIKDIQLFP